MYFNFELLKNEYIDDIKSEAFLYKHKSGTLLIFLKNNDINKVFSAIFKTLPNDNTGVAHIVEHCVLCGSKNYPVKDPFNILEKGSLHTYLNAITFSDKTMYPIASTNENDFINLMNVYLDAVFFPNIYKNEEIFLQEGWHYGNNGINGVVYNEMKGAFSSPEKKMNFEIKRHLFNSTNYSFSSGGVPQNITDLSYSEFLNYHSKYYNSSNCIMYLYGDIDIEKYLEFIDKDYLCKMENRYISIGYKKQQSFKPTSFIEKYVIDNNGSSLESKNHLALGIKVDVGLNYNLIMAFDIITSALLYTSASPLKKALVNANIAQNITGYFDSDMFEPMFVIKAENTNEKDTTKFKNIVFDSLKDIVKNGIDKKIIQGCINKFKFYLKEEDFGYKPKGLYYNIMLMQSFLYNDISFEPIKINSIFESLKDICFEELIQKYLIENENYVCGLLEATYDYEKSQQPDFINKEQQLKEYQIIKDKKEDIEKIPLINFSEISTDILMPQTYFEQKGNQKIIFNCIDNDISYIDFYFDTKVINNNDIYYIGILKYLLGKLDTKNYNCEEISSEINCYLGGFGTEFISFEDDKTNYFPKVKVSSKIMIENSYKMFDIIEQVIFKTQFKDKERIKKLMLEYKSKNEKNYLYHGGIAAVYRGASYMFERFYYSEKVNGIEFYKFLNVICKDLDNNIDNIIEKLKDVCKLLFNNNNLIVSITSNNKNYNKIYKELSTFIQCMDNSINPLSGILENKSKINEAFIINSDIVFNSISYNFKKLNIDYRGYTRVLSKIIESDFIWNKIRLEGGAYGGSFNINRNGLIYAYSYRDPNVERTYSYFNNIYNYLQNLNLSDRDIKMYIIGALNILEKPLKNNQISDIVVGRHIGSINYERLKEEKYEILNFSQLQIKKFNYFVEKSFSDGVKCSIGNKEKLQTFNNIFDNIETL